MFGLVRLTKAKISWLVETAILNTSFGMSLGIWIVMFEASFISIPGWNIYSLTLEKFPFSVK